MNDYDIVVIGGGAGGLVAAKEARRRGARVLLIQSGPIGGDCTFTGCVPSKAMLSAAAERMTFEAAMSRVRTAITTIAATEDAAALAHEGIDVIDGYARFVDRRVVQVDGRRIRSDRFIVATGARAFIPPVPGLRESAPLTNETVFELERCPASLTILGGGPIGCEMAQAFARLGSKVTIIEANDRLLPRDDPQAGEVVEAALRRDGVDVKTSTSATGVERDGESRTCMRTDRGEVIVSTHLLVASGREPSGRGFGLEEIGVTVDERGAIIVDDTMSTGVEGIWAVGDVTGRMQFTHVAGRMGWVAATNALSRLAKLRRFRFDSRVVPWTTFTSPEVAHVGLTVAQALRAHPDARVAHLSMEHVDRAVAVGATDGFVTLIAAPKRGTRHLAGGRLVGATVVAPTAGELIHEAALAIQTNMFVGRLAQTTHAYPTWSMAMQQTALQFFGKSVGFTATPIAEHAGAGTN